MRVPKHQSFRASHALQCRLHLPSPGVTSPQHPTMFCALHTINGVVVRLIVLLCRAIISPKPDSLPLSLYLPDAVKLTTLQVQVCWTSEFTTQTPQAIRVSGPRSRPASGVLRKAPLYESRIKTCSIFRNLARPCCDFRHRRKPRGSGTGRNSSNYLALQIQDRLFCFRSELQLARRLSMFLVSAFVLLRPTWDIAGRFQN